jgi:ribosomal protein S18 acetylase RimI-like enzyme
MRARKPGLVDSLQQFIEVWQLLARPFDGADLQDMPGIAVSWAGVSFPFYNVLFLTEQFNHPSLLEVRVRSAADYMRKRLPTGGILFLCRDNIFDPAKQYLAEILAMGEFVEALPLTGMVGNLLPLEAAEGPLLGFRRIQDRESIRDFVRLNCLSYSLPLELGENLVDETTLWHNHAFGYIAYKDGEAVATATAIVNGNCLFLFLVATHPNFRRHGYGNAVVRYALQRAHEATGIHRTVLHATRDGYPLYKRLGYQDTELFMGYALKA